MKKITFLIFLFAAFFSSLHAQQKVKQRVNELESTGVRFVHFSLLDEDNTLETPESSSAVTQAVYGTLKNQSLQQIVNNGYETIEVEIPYIGETLVAKLYKVNLFTDSFTVNTDKASDVAYTPGVYYRGIIEGEDTSVVSFNFFGTELNGILSSARLGNIVVGKLQSPGNTDNYIVYADHNLTAPLDFECHTDDEKYNAPEVNNEQNKTNLDGNTLKCVTMYFEIDNDLYLQNNSSISDTGNWMTSVFNNVQTLYSNDGINVALNDFFIWTTVDPYIGTSSGENLYYFYENRDVFNADVGQLIGIDSGGLGGLASTINGLCSADSNRAYSDVNLGYSTVPTYSWTVEVITHEYGHILGSRHTHACVWNGNNTAIDGCGQQAGYTEGSCDQAAIPTSGTIMSYCHLISGVGINLSLGFGTQPATAITNAVNAATCLSTDCINTCINLVYDIQVTNITTSSALITWSSSGSASQWQIAVTVGTFPLDVWNTVSTTSYPVSNLQANQYYRVKIRPLCSSGQVSGNRQQIFATNGDVCGGLVYTDSGGAVGQYTDDEHVVRTFTPNVAGKVATVNFTAFDLELDYDYLYVYNGPDTSYPLLTPDGLTGDDIPDTFTSTAADGSLTFEFISDGGVTAAGWSANVSCSDAMGLFHQNAVDYSYYPNPTNGVVTITAVSIINKVTVYNATGQLLYSALPEKAAAEVDLSKFATGTYFFTLDVEGTAVNFKVMKY